MKTICVEELGDIPKEQEEKRKEAGQTGKCQESRKKHKNNETKAGNVYGFEGYDFRERKNSRVPEQGN